MKVLRRSIVLARSWGGLSALIVLLTAGSATQAAEVKVLSGMGMRAILTKLAPDFERATGHTLNIAYGTAGLVKERIGNGEIADAAIMQRYLLDELLERSRIVRGTTVNIARSPVGLVGRAGSAKPDISTVDTLRDALLKAESIAYTDPAAGGLSGTHFAKVLERLGIAAQMKAKTRLGRPMARIVSGEVEFAVLQMSEILSLTGVQLIGPFPEILQENTPVSAAIVHGSEQSDAALALIKFLSSAAAAKVLKSHGMEPIEQR